MVRHKGPLSCPLTKHTATITGRLIRITYKWFSLFQQWRPVLLFYPKFPIDAHTCACVRMHAHTHTHTNSPRVAELNIWAAYNICEQDVQFKEELNLFDQIRC